MSDKLQAKLQFTVDIEDVPKECGSLMLRAHKTSNIHDLMTKLEEKLLNVNFIGHPSDLRNLAESVGMLEKYRDSLMALDQRATEVINMLNGLLRANSSGEKSENPEKVNEGFNGQHTLKQGNE